MAFPNSGSLPAFTQMDANKSIISPLFLGQEYMQYFDVLPNIKGTTSIDHLGSLSKITKAHNAGAFAGEDTGSFSGVTISPARVEAELEFRTNTLFGKVKGQLMRGNYEFDNVDGTAVKAALVSLIEQGIRADFNRQLFLADTGSGSADYSIYDGIFEAANTSGATQRTGADVGQTVNVALEAGKGVTILKDLYDNADAALLEQGNLVFFVSGDIADDYMVTLEGTGYAAAGWGALKDGVPQLTWRGIPIVVRRDWDGAIATDFANINGASVAAETYRAILTTQNAFIVGTDFDEPMMEQWYSQDNKSYRFRVSYMCGVALADSKLAVVFTADALA